MIPARYGSGRSLVTSTVPTRAEEVDAGSSERPDRSSTGQIVLETALPAELAGMHLMTTSTVIALGGSTSDVESAGPSISRVTVYPNTETITGLPQGASDRDVRSAFQSLE